MTAIDFLQQQLFDVTVFDDELGEIGAAKLSFGPERWPHLSFGFLSPPTKLPKGKLLRPLKAKTPDGDWFSLFDCKRFDFEIGIGFVVAGNAPGEFKQIDIRYSEISEWFLPWRQLNGTVGETISWTPANHINATISVKRTRFALKTSTEASITKSGEDHIIHQHVIFSFEDLTGHFRVEDIRSKVLELSNLLSILIAYPLSVVSVRAGSADGSWHDIFFSTFKHVDRDKSNDFSLHCFIRHVDLADRWEVILNRYFNSSFRPVSWTRLAGMQRYEGFWEYRALGYVTLLDKYVDQRIKGAKKVVRPVGPEAMDKLVEAMKTVSPPLSDHQRETVLSAVNRVFSHARELEFAEKYQKVISESNPDLIKIVNILDEDFDLIKTVRNKIAHGKALDLPEAKLERIGTVVSKIVLLMTYWAFLDFGLTDDDFLRCLQNTFNSLKFAAEPDRVHLDRVTRPDLFLQVSKAEFQKISQLTAARADVCFVKHPSGMIRYSKKYSTLYRKWSFGCKKQGITKHSEIFGDEHGNFAHLSPAYIVHDEAVLSFATAWLIS